MNILIKRIARKDNYTIGKLYINGQCFCDTLEDKDRGLKQSDNIITIKTKKIFGKTAIPMGKYNVVLSYSPKFKKILPLVENVKGFSGIRIHQGNTADDTEGCIIVGRNKIVGMVTHSEDTLKALLQKLNVDESITLTIY